MDVQPQIIHVVIYKIFYLNNPVYAKIVVFSHDFDDSPFGGTREETLENIESLNCGSTVSDEVDYDVDIGSVLADLVQVKYLFDKLKMIIISLCEPDGGDLPVVYKIQLIQWIDRNYSD